MYYVTGDTHGNQMLWDICITCFLKPGDTIIVTGNFGHYYIDRERGEGSMLCTMLSGSMAVSYCQ